MIQFSLLSLASLFVALTSQAADFGTSAFPICPPWLPGCSQPAEEPAAGLPGDWTQGKAGNEFGERAFYLYVASTAKSKPAIPLMVMMHGCFQSAAEFARQTGMNEIAEKYGFAVLYPEQGYADNIWKCWNWFRPENHVRNDGETGVVVSMIRDISARIPLDPKRIYAAGLSAGAAMASNLGACYSDIFAGVAVHSGLGYKAAVTESEAHRATRSGMMHEIRDTAQDAVQCVGKSGRPLAVVALHGKEDPFVNPLNSTQVVQQFSKINDLLDDGKENDSQTPTVIVSRPGSVPNGYTYTTEFYGGSGSIHIEKILVDQMAHAWSGAHESAQYADPKGPDASEAIWLFFANYGASRR